MTIKVCDHKSYTISEGNLWEKGWSHPNVKMGNRVRHSTPGPVGYDIYIKEEVDEKIKAIEEKINTNVTDIADGTTKTMNKIAELKNNIINDKGFQNAIVLALSADEEFRKKLLDSLNVGE
jgi:hypothetical protein